MLYRALQNGERDFVRFAMVLLVSCRALQNGERDVGRVAMVLMCFLVAHSKTESATNKPTKPLQNAQRRALRFGERDEKFTKP